MKRNQKTMTRHPTAVVEPIKFLAMISKGKYCHPLCVWQGRNHTRREAMPLLLPQPNNWQQQHNRKFVFHKAHSTSIHVGLLVCCRVCVCVCVYIKISKIKRRDTSSMLIVHSQSCMRCLILVSFSLSLSIHYGPNGWAFCLVRVASSIIHNTTTTTTREKNKNWKFLKKLGAYQKNSEGRWRGGGHWESFFLSSANANADRRVLFNSCPDDETRAALAFVSLSSSSIKSSVSRAGRAR